MDWLCLSVRIFCFEYFGRSMKKAWGWAEEVWFFEAKFIDWFCLLARPFSCWLETWEKLKDWLRWCGRGLLLFDWLGLCRDSAHTSVGRELILLEGVDFGVGGRVRGGENFSCSRFLVTSRGDKVTLTVFCLWRLCLADEREGVSPVRSVTEVLADEPETLDVVNVEE